MFGDGVFRTVRVVDGVISHWNEHIEKLLEDSLRIFIDLQTPSLRDIAQLIHSKNAQKGVWRLKIVAVAKKRKDLFLDTPVKGKLHFELTPFDPFFAPLQVGFFVAPFHRLICKAKTLSYLDQLMLLTWGREKGFSEVLTQDSNGYILEGAISNLFLKEKGNLYLMDPSLPYYEGVTQKLTARHAEAMGLKIHYTRIKPSELFRKELYLCNALRGITPIFSLEGKCFPTDEAFTLQLNRKLDFHSPLL